MIIKDTILSSHSLLLYSPLNEFLHKIYKIHVYRVNINSFFFMTNIFNIPYTLFNFMIFHRSFLMIPIHLMIHSILIFLFQIFLLYYISLKNFRMLCFSLNFIVTLEAIQIIFLIPSHLIYPNKLDHQHYLIIHHYFINILGYHFIIILAHEFIRSCSYKVPNRNVDILVFIAHIGKVIHCDYYYSFKYKLLL